MLRAWTSLKMQENNIDRFLFSSRLSFKLDEDWKRYTRIDFLIGFSFLPSSRNIFYFREAREWVEIEMRGYDRLTSNISDCFAWNGERNGDRRFFAMPVESKYTCSGWNKNRSINFYFYTCTIFVPFWISCFCAKTMLEKIYSNIFIFIFKN